jgi:hypothetical protein
MLLREMLDMIAARHQGSDLGIDAMDALIGVHVQFRDEAAADQANSYFAHRHTRWIKVTARRLLTRNGRWQH